MKKTLIATLILCTGALSSAPVLATTTQSAQQSLSVMTFNIRNSSGWADDGINNWNRGRKERTIALINFYHPDILGVQEAIEGKTGLEVSDLQKLPQYQWYGVGRDDGVMAGENEGILFLKSRFQLLKAGTFWLSHTPEKPGTTFSTTDMEPKGDANSPRNANWVILYDKNTKQRYFVLNQHWGVATATQMMEAKLMRAKIKELSQGLPVIVMGDFNMTEQSPHEKYSLNPLGAYQYLLNGEPGSSLKLIDNYRSVYPKFESNPAKSEMTYHGFYGGLKPSPIDLKQYPEDISMRYRIDYVFTNQAFKATHAQIVRNSFAKQPGQWPSDHYPVLVDLTLTTKKG